MNRPKGEIASPRAPTTSGTYTPEEDHRPLNFLRLFRALIRLKNSEKSNVIKVEKSLDGNSEVYLKEPESRPTLLSPSLHTSPANGGPLTIESIDQLIQRLKILAETQGDPLTPTTPPYNLQVSLDNCTLFYIPADHTERSESCDPSTSVEGQTPSELYYNLTSPSTLKFIQRALMRRSDTPSRAEGEVIEKPIIILHPKRSQGKASAGSPSTGDISRPDLAELLKRKLEELKIDGDVCQAIDDENVEIITLNYSPCSNSGSISSNENSTPVLSRSDYPNLLSPKTNSKLLRKLHAVQEDLEGEDEIIDMRVLFLPKATQIFNRDQMEKDSAKGKRKGRRCKSW